MNNGIRFLICAALLILSSGATRAQDRGATTSSLYELAPRWLVDVPTAGTLPRAYYDLGVRFYPDGGAIGFTDIGLSNRLQLGISYGSDNVISNKSPGWNSDIEFSIKFGIIDELEYFPAVSVGFSSQGFGPWSGKYDRYTFKSRGFYLVASRSFYFYQWTAGWHAGINHSLESDVDEDKDINLFIGADATFKYNLAVMIELDAGLNDDRSELPNGKTNEMAGKGRGYLNMSVKWLFTGNLELEALLKDLTINRRESETFTREIRLTYIDRF